MKKLKILAFIAVIAVLVLSFCGCNTTEPDVNTPPSTSVNSEVSTTDDVLPDTSKQDIPEAGETEPEFSAEDNDLEIITHPQTEAADVVDSEAQSEYTESVEESTVAQTTEEKKIELPFVPAN